MVVELSKYYRERGVSGAVCWGVCIMRYEVMKSTMIPFGVCPVSSVAMSRSDHGCAYFHVLGHSYLGTHRFKHWNPHRSGTWSGLRMAEQCMNSSLPTAEQTQRGRFAQNQVAQYNPDRRPSSTGGDGYQLKTQKMALLFVCLSRLPHVDVERGDTGAPSRRPGPTSGVKLDSSLPASLMLVVVEQMALPVPTTPYFLRGRNVLDRLAILTGSRRRG